MTKLLRTKSAGTKVAEGAWDGSASRFTDAQYRKSCILDRADCGDVSDMPVKQRYSLPVREPEGEVNRAACHAAASRIGGVKACADAKRKAAGRLVRLYRSELDEDPPEALVEQAGKDARHGEHRKAVFPMQRLKLAEPDAEGKRSFQGYAAVFGNRDSYGDIIVKGAFEKSLREKPEVKVLWQHDSAKPIGLGTGYEDEYGLAVTGTLSSTTFNRDEVVPLLSDGVVNGLSIGYDVVVEERNENLEAWLLKEIDLWEFSPVTFPANELAVVQQVKTLDVANARQDAHAESVARHAKSLSHLLGGYFEKDSRRDALDFDPLRKLHALLAGVLPGVDGGSAPADDELEAAFLEGAHSALDGLEAAHTEPKE